MPVLLLAGCDPPTPVDQPELAPVVGIVTLDGEPLAGADISFSPRAGRTSSAVSDENGRYELRYLPTVNGAVLGRHTVRVTTFRTEDAEDGTIRVLVPERVPNGYNAKSKLFVVVAEGENDIPLELESGRGEIVQPSLDEEPTVEPVEESVEPVDPDASDSNQPS